MKKTDDEVRTEQSYSDSRDGQMSTALTASDLTVITDTHFLTGCSNYEEIKK